MSEMIDRVARAIEEASQPPGRPDYALLMRNCAIAAIESMREPTAAMLDAGPPEPYMDKDVWAKMIDAALSRI